MVQMALCRWWCSPDEDIKLREHFSGLSFISVQFQPASSQPGLEGEEGECDDEYLMKLRAIYTDRHTTILYSNSSNYFIIGIRRSLQRSNITTVGLAELQLCVKLSKILLDITTERAPHWLVILVYQSCPHAFVEIRLQKPSAHQAVLHL